MGCYSYLLNGYMGYYSYFLNGFMDIPFVTFYSLFEGTIHTLSTAIWGYYSYLINGYVQVPFVTFCSLSEGTIHSFSCFIEEAMVHFRKAFLDLVRTNEEPVLVSFARMFNIFIKQRGIDRDLQVFTYSEDGNTNRKQIL